MGDALLHQWMLGPLAPYLTAVQRVEAVTISASRAQVYRLWDATQPISFLKVEVSDAATTLAADVARLRWLAHRLPVPQVLAYYEDENACYLLTSVVPGTDTATLAEWDDTDIAQVVRLLAAGLRQVHAVEITDCPFDAKFEQALAQVRQRLDLGLVDERAIGGPWGGRTIPDLFAELLATAPVQEGLVFTHGDACLPNILVEGNRVSGFVDLGRAGVGDRYRDLALAQRSLIRNCGEAWVPLFFAEYGLPQPDQAKLTFYQLLDEFY